MQGTDGVSGLLWLDNHKTTSDGQPFCFSSRLTGTETGLLDYRYRYYNPTTERWPNRDPIGENAGLNFCGFAYNYGINSP